MYLTDEMAILAYFDADVDEETKFTMLANLQKKFLDL
jgi:hypothetical protein